MTLFFCVYDIREAFLLLITEWSDDINPINRIMFGGDYQDHHSGFPLAKEELRLRLIVYI